MNKGTTTLGKRPRDDDKDLSSSKSKGKSKDKGNVKKRSLKEGHQSKDVLVNFLTPEQAGEIYSEQLERGRDFDQCRVSASFEKGGYARAYIPKKYLNGYPGGIPEKKLRRVSVSWLAIRARGELAPNYLKNEDAKHSCGRGRGSDSNPVNCIKSEHISKGSHKSNMDEQRCVPVVKCEHCHLYTQTCVHNPVCVSSSTNLYKDQKGVKKITIEYEDGSTQTIIPHKE